MRRSRVALLGIGALVAVTGVAVVLRSSVACAAPPPAAAAARSGRATFYGPASPGGACSFPAPPADRLTAAAGPADYAQAAACGGYLDVSGRLGTVRVKVDNLCPECEPGHLDLSTEAFSRLDSPSVGVTPIRFQQVTDPALSSGLTFRVKEGSSQWWLAVLVDQHGNPLRSVEVSPDQGHSWKALARTGYNYWLAASGAGTGPFSVRVTDVRGHVAVASGIALRPGAVQVTAARLYGAGAVGGSASSVRTPGTQAPGTRTPGSPMPGNMTRTTSGPTPGTSSASVSPGDLTASPGAAEPDGAAGAPSRTGPPGVPAAGHFWC
jgi:expansin